MRVGTFRAACLIVTLLAALAGRAMAQTNEGELVAVLDLEGAGASNVESSALTDKLREELLKTRRFTLVNRGQMEAVLNEQALQQTGCTTQDCAVQVGRMLGVRKLIAGKVVKLSEQQWLVTCLMVDVETAETLRAESVQYNGGLFNLLSTGMHELAQKLAGVDRATRAPVVASMAPTPAAIQPTVVVPGAVWREPVTGMEFIYVQGGDFEQGCVVLEKECGRDETPTIRVHVDPFWISRTEVTQAAYVAVMRKNPAVFRGRKGGEDHPVENVSWEDIQRFLAKLIEMSKIQDLRVPTESEWEFACRAGGQLVAYGTSTGQLEPTLANYGSSKDRNSSTSPVASFPPNALGLFDMSGNVMEIVDEEYQRYDEPADPTATKRGRRSRTSQVIRGGGYASDSQDARCSDRKRGGENRRWRWVGFRLARSP